MIGQILNLTRWEWFKLRRRWMPWILLLILVGFSQLIVWGNYFSFRAGHFGAGATPAAYASFTLPQSIPNALAVAHNIGIILMVILAASVLGTEYNWSTLRSILARGTGRWQYLASKGILLALVAAGALLLVTVVTVISSLIAGAIAGSPPAGPVPAQFAAHWPDVAIALGKSWFAFFPYVSLTFLLTVLTTSSAAGMAITLGYFFGELIGSAILLALSDSFQKVADYLIGRNTTAWMSSVGGGRFGGGGNGGTFPSELHAFLVLLVYLVVLGGLALWLFRRKDVPGTGGG